MGELLLHLSQYHGYVAISIVTSIMCLCIKLIVDQYQNYRVVILFGSRTVRIDAMKTSITTERCHHLAVSQLTGLSYQGEQGEPDPRKASLEVPGYRLAYMSAP